MTTSAWRPAALLSFALIPIGAAIGGFFSYRPGPQLSIDPPAQSAVPGVMIGAAIGAVIATIVLTVEWRSVRRRARVLALHPDAVIIEAGDVEATGAALASLRGGLAPVGHAYTIAFAGDGMHVYQGHELVPITRVGWDRIVQIREDYVDVSAKPRPALIVEISTDDMVVALALVTTASYGFESPTAKVETVASAVAVLRKNAAAMTLGVAPRVAAQFATPVRRELLPGVPSTRWRTWAKLPPYIGGAATFLVVVAQLSSAQGLSRGAFLPAIMVIFAMTLVSLLLFFMGMRVAKRERAAGYTLDRVGDVEVDQVDPKTGYIIRRAGEPQLTKAAEAVELQRVRARGITTQGSRQGRY